MEVADQEDAFQHIWNSLDIYTFFLFLIGRKDNQQDHDSFYYNGAQTFSIFR